jgi:hypothetical protein
VECSLSCSIARNALSSSSRPVNIGLRAGTFHTRLTAACSNPTRPDPGQLYQRLKQCLAQPLRSADRRCGQPSLAQPGPKRGLSVAVFSINKQTLRTFRVVAEQEHQPGQTRFASGLELQLGIGQLRLISHRRSVLKSDNGHINIGGLHRLSTHLRRLPVTGGEIRHITDSIPRTGHCPLRRSHERPTHWQPTQLRRMTQKHPPRPHHRHSIPSPPATHSRTTAVSSLTASTMIIVGESSAQGARSDHIGQCTLALWPQLSGMQ